MLHAQIPIGRVQLAVRGRAPPTGTDSTEDDLGELKSLKRPVGDTAHDFEWFLDDGYGQVCPIVHKSGNVVFRHLWELVLEDTFQTSEYDKGLSLVVIVDDTELDFAFPFFDRRGKRGLCSGNTCGFFALAT